MNEKVEEMAPQPTWFFETSDGQTFAVNEKEAFELMTNKSKWRRQDLTMIGMSDGTTYHEVIRGAKAKTASLSEEVLALKKRLNKYVAGHDKLLFEEFAEEDDPRVVRARKLITEIEEKIEPLEEQIKSLREDLIKTAFNAELEKARGNKVNPRDFSVVAKGGNNPMHQQALQSFANAKRAI